MNLYFRKSCYMLLAMLVVNYSLAVTVNNKELTSIISNADQMISYSIKPLEDAEANIFLSIKDGKIEIGSMHLNNVKDLQDSFNNLEEQKDELSKTISQNTVSLKSGKSLRLKGAYLSGDNKIVLESGDTIDITKAILKSKEIVLISDIFKIYSCFIDTDTLQLESNNPESIFKIIEFKLNKNISVPTMIEGKIDFTKDETEKNFIVIGATEVNIVFNPKAFEKSNS